MFESYKAKQAGQVSADSRPALEPVDFASIETTLILDENILSRKR
jgi:hypothetical protein